MLMLALAVVALMAFAAQTSALRMTRDTLETCAYLDNISVYP